MLCPWPKPKKLLACDPAFLQVQGLHATRLHTKRLIARLKRACTAGRGSHAWRPSSKLEPSNFCKILAFLCEKFWKFSTRPEDPNRPLGCFDRHHLNFFAQFRPVVLCQYLDIQDLTLVSRECTVSGLESILVFQSQTKHCITSSFATGRFCPSPVRKFPLESIWIFRPLGCIDRHD